MNIPKLIIVKNFLLVYISCFSISCSDNKSQGNNTTIDAKYHKNVSASIVIDSLQKNKDGGYLAFVENHYDFGTVKAEKTSEIAIDVDFTNTGNAPVVILKSDVSCGCLSVDYDKQPIRPNESRRLRIFVNTKKQQGYFNKTVFIKSNAVNDVELIRIKGTIK